MIKTSWITDSIGSEKLERAYTEASRRRLCSAFEIASSKDVSDEQLSFISNALELRVFDLLDDADPKDLMVAASDVFSLARVLELPDTPSERAEALVRLGCLGFLADRGSDVKRILRKQDFTFVTTADIDWGERVWVTILESWLHIFREQGWDDLRAIHQNINDIRSAQRTFEPNYLDIAKANEDTSVAWELVSSYHLAKATEIMGFFRAQGAVEGHFDVREQLEFHFDRSLTAASRGVPINHETLIRLLSRTAQTLIDNSIWTVTRAVNTRVTQFVESLVSPNREQPIFGMLPPQRHTLSEEGLLGSNHRSVVLTLPTSSGKTLIAEFRILQALNQFDTESGWIAYLAPTRALVNQITRRLRSDFADINCVVEKVSPALEIDGLESEMLQDRSIDEQFRILVTTPEKFDLMLRGGWEEKIRRPLTLVVVDEAHGIGTPIRGLRLELLLATINRECRYAQFLLLTPFIRNAKRIASWLAPDSNKSIGIDLDWVPNDRAIVLATPKKGKSRGDFRVEFVTQHTSRETINIPDCLRVGLRRPLGLSWSDVHNSPGKLAASTAQLLHRRGTVIVLVGRPSNSWAVAKALAVKENRVLEHHGDVEHIKTFLEDEMGPEYPLISLLDYGIGVHHSGLSDDARTLIESLTERSILKVLVATTTIAQGVNFPVSGVVFASHQYPYGLDIPPADFWNIAGRSGRIHQEDLGIVALAGHSDDKVKQIEKFLDRSISELNSTLIEMVREVFNSNENLKLEELSYLPEWSAFVQYLTHSYRQIGDHARFASQIEQVLRGTLGFRDLRKKTRRLADDLVNGVYRYTERIKGKPLKLVDTTGFSWESVSHTLLRLKDARLTREIWTPDLFSKDQRSLKQIFGVLLEVPELRKPLREVVRGTDTDGEILSRIVCDWVQGVSLTEIASQYFRQSARNDVESMTKCCTKIFGKLTQTASWGIAALQALAFGDAWETLSTEEQLVARNLPARVYYGVNSDAALALRVLGVPRTAATPLAAELKLETGQSLYKLRSIVRNAGENVWKLALGEKKGLSYHRVWSIMEGDV